MTGSKRTFLGMAEAGEPLLTQALEAIRAYNDALERKRPAAEIERLRVEADHLYHTVFDYQVYKAGALGEWVH
ncbi:hypothetical protein [Pseudomonas alloputida]|uniref:hypothetical protein n=1 Tax=Pseudomonas TaxID=286 RepID=UPI003EEF1E07